MNPILQVFYSVYSGLILGFALPNELYSFGCPYLVIFALIPFYYAISNSKNYGFAFLSGFFQIGTAHLFSSFWLANFKNFAALTLGASGIATAVIGAVFGLFLYLPYSDSLTKNKLSKNSLVYKIKNSISFRIFYFAGIYTLYEWVKSCGFFGYPWATLSTTVYNWNVLMQLASITGTYGITFILALINALLAELLVLFFNHNKLNQYQLFDLKITSKVTGILLLISLLHGIYWADKKFVPQKTLTSIVVQQNSDPWMVKNDSLSITTSQELTIEQIHKLMDEEEKDPELIIWSEGTLRYRYPDAEVHYKSSPSDDPLEGFIKRYQCPLLTGGAYTKDRKNKIFFNSAIIFDSKGNFRGAYGKNHLVPLAESIPFMEYKPVKDFLSKIIGISSGWTPGDQYVFFDIPCTDYPTRKLPAVKNIDISIPHKQQVQIDEKKPNVKIAAPICYDDAFPDIMRPLFLNGAELFVNLTDDSWSLKKSSEYQHFVVASYRAIEYRTTLVRCTNAGYSVVLDPRAKILADLPLFEKSAFWYDVPIYQRRMTTYARFGNWLPWLLFILFMSYCVYSYLIFTPDDYISGVKKIKLKKHKKHKKHHKK